MKSKIKKKILSIILAVVTTVVSMPLVPVKAAPENDTASGNENDEQYIISSEASDNTMDASGNSSLGEVSIAITAPTSHRSEIDGIVIFRMNKTEAMQMAENDKIYIKGSVEPADLANDHKISLLIWDDMGMEDIIENCEPADDGSITYGYSVSGCVADHHVIFQSSKNDDISKEVELQICFDTPIVSLKDNKLRISNKDSDPLAKYYLVYFDGAQWLYEPIFEDDQTEYEISYRLSGIKDAYVTVSRFGASEYIENFSYDTLSANSASFDLPVITERTLDSSGIYQVSGNTSISTPYPNTLFDVKVITDIDMLEESTVSGDIVSSDESGRIEIDPKWLGHDISIVAKGGTRADGVILLDSEPVYLPVVHFIDEQVLIDIDAPKTGNDIAMGSMATNVKEASLNVAWTKTKEGVTSKVKSGDLFMAGVSYNAAITVTLNSIKSFFEEDLELVQFMYDYVPREMPAYAVSASSATMIRSEITRADGKSAGKDNYTGYKILAYFGEPSDSIRIAAIEIDDIWNKGIVWTENQGIANNTVIKGRIFPKNADETLSISVNDIEFVKNDASANACDDVVRDVEFIKSETGGEFTLSVNGSDTRYKGGFAELVPSSSLSGNIAVEKLGKCRVTVKYADLTSVSVCVVQDEKTDGSKRDFVSIKGLEPAENYKISVSGNARKDIYLKADASGNICSKDKANRALSVVKGKAFTISHVHEKTAFIGMADSAALKLYESLSGKDYSVSADTLKFMDYGGIFFEYQDEYVYTGSKITPVIHVFEGDRELIEGQDFSVSYKNNLNAGTGIAKVKGKNGSNIEKTELKFKIKQAQLSDATIVPVQSVNGKKGAQPVVIYNGKKMAQKKTYNKLNKDDLKCSEGEKTVVMTGKGNFIGEAEVKVICVGKKKKISGVKLSTKKFAYKGHFDRTEDEQIVNSITNFDEATMDIIWPHDENFIYGNAGSYDLGIVGKGDLAGAYKVLKFKITPCKNAQFKLLNTALTYNPRGAVFSADDYVINGIDGDTPVEGLDYSISYKSNRKVGAKATVIVTFKGSYKGSKKGTEKFTINKANISEIAKVWAAPVATQKKAKKNTAYVYVPDMGNVLLKKGKSADYTTAVALSETTGEITVTGAGNYTGSLSVSFNILDSGTDFSKSKIKVTNNNKLFYNGFEKTDKADDANNKVNISLSKVTITEDNGGTYHFFNNVNKGKAIVVLAGDGVNSTGSKIAKFKIKGNKRTKLEEAD